MGLVQHVSIANFSQLDDYRLTLPAAPTPGNVLVLSIGGRGDRATYGQYTINGVSPADAGFTEVVSADTTVTWATQAIRVVQAGDPTSYDLGNLSTQGIGVVPVLAEFSGVNTDTPLGRTGGFASTTPDSEWTVTADGSAYTSGELVVPFSLYRYAGRTAPTWSGDGNVATVDHTEDAESATCGATLGVGSVAQGITPTVTATYTSSPVASIVMTTLRVTTVPAPNAGPNLTRQEGQPLAITAVNNGSSADTRTWSLPNPGGTALTIDDFVVTDDPGNDRTTITLGALPSVQGQTAITLRATFANSAGSASDDVTVTITDVNQRPTAVPPAGGPVEEGTVVTVDWSQSYDPEDTSGEPDEGSVAYGIWSDAVSAATLPFSGAAVPDAPTSVVASAGDGSITASFVAPASDGGSAILEYRVTASPGGETALGTSSPITIYNLTNGQAYTVTVAARNAAGWSAESTASNTVTPSAASWPTSDSAVGLAGVSIDPSTLTFLSNAEGDYYDTLRDAADFDSGTGTQGDPFIYELKNVERHIFVDTGAGTYVTFRRCQISGTSNRAIEFASGVYAVVEDCNIGVDGKAKVDVLLELRGGGEVRRCLMESAGDFIRAYQTVVVEDCRLVRAKMVWNGGNTGSMSLDYKHVDGIQCTDGTSVNLTVRRTYIDLWAQIVGGWAAPGYYGGNAGFQFKPDDVGQSIIVWEDVYVRARNYGLNVSSSETTPASTVDLIDLVLDPDPDMDTSFLGSAVDRSQSGDSTSPTPNTVYTLNGVRKPARLGGGVWYQDDLQAVPGGNGS